LHAWKKALPCELMAKSSRLHTIEIALGNIAFQNTCVAPGGQAKPQRRVAVQFTCQRQGVWGVLGMDECESAAIFEKNNGPGFPIIIA
jgi:hypothetical protein